MHNPVRTVVHSQCTVQHHTVLHCTNKFTGTVQKSPVVLISHAVMCVRHMHTVHCADGLFWTVD